MSNTSIDHSDMLEAPRQTSGRLKTKFIFKSRLYTTLFLLMLPTFLGMAIFNYYPKWGAIKYAFFEWDGSHVEEFIGLKNFKEAFSGADPLFWQSFKVVGILLAANLVKMFPSIFAAVAIHRLRSDRWQYIYRVLFVIPMVVPALVFLLIWKNFYDPTVGILNSILRATGLMGALQWMDTAMPNVAETLSPINSWFVNPVFSSVWGLAIAGVLLLNVGKGLRGVLQQWIWWLILASVSLAILGLEWYGPVILVVALALGEIKCRMKLQTEALKWTGVVLVCIASLLVLLTMTWTEPTKAFADGRPAWLGNTNLIIPAMIFWGFPWVGVVGVLIYLAGLQSISNDVYEAAELDGVGPIGKLFKIELPLIMTQVRINLIFMTIGTLNTYGLFLLLLGPDGGPGNKGLVPGLYMYGEAFINGRFGYACALGMVLFVMILMITILYQKYVKVEK